MDPCNEPELKCANQQNKLKLMIENRATAKGSLHSALTLKKSPHKIKTDIYFYENFFSPLRGKVWKFDTHMSTDL